MIPAPRDEAAARIRVRKEFAIINVASYRLEDQVTGSDVADLLIAKHPHYWFMELKVDAPLSPGQRGWLDSKWQHTRAAYLLKYDRPGRHWRLWAGCDSDILVPGRELWYGRVFDAMSVLNLIEEITYG